MEMSGNYQFDLFGVRLQGQSSEEANVVANFVKKKAGEITKSNPLLSNDEKAVLLALTIAKEYLSLKREIQNNVAQIETSAEDALRFIEELGLPVS